MGSLFSDENWTPDGAIECDLRHLEGTCCYCDSQAESEIEKAIAPLPLRALHWIDSGDYHYLTELWMRKLTSPARLVLYDNHPDDQEPAFGAGILSCGGWVAHSERTNPMLDKESDLLYISIDLDVLSHKSARTNWNQGEMSLPELIDKLSREIDGKEIAGVDICGGITAAKGGTDEDFEINRRTRDALWSFFKVI